VFGNRALRGIFGRKREGVDEDWGQLHKGKRHNLQSSSHINYSNYNDQIKEDEMRGHEI
jgi:hypothetical protein